jgi:predicted Holliday junction resolvase-like endonuclease
MARAKTHDRPDVKSHSEQLWEEYQSIQLTPEQKTAAREELWKQIEEARRKGVYEGLMALVGKVHLDMDDIREARKSKR